MNVITAVSSKGGVTKTTLISNFGALLADCGYRVLLIDADNTQPSLSTHYPRQHTAPAGLTRLIRDRFIGDQVISKTTIAGLDIVTSDDPSDALAEYILHEADGRYRIRQAMQILSQRDQYDFVLIDTRGAKGPVLETAMFAADIFLSPISPDILSAREFFRGTVELYRKLKDSARYMDVHLPPLYSLLTRVERTRDCRRIVDNLKDEIRQQADLVLLETAVNASTAYKAAATAQMPAHLFDPVGTTTRISARHTMMNVLRELFDLHHRHRSDFSVPEVSLPEGVR